MTDGQPRHSRRSLMRAAGITAAAGAFAAYGHGSVSARGRAPAAGNFPETPEWNFVFVNHVTTNPFFVPTIYGLEDASAMLGLPTPQWTGSETSEIGEMVNAFEAAIAAGADGIAVSLVDLEAFNDPIQQALDAGIPVVSYNADAPNARMAYVGQDLYGSGFAMGERIVEIVGEGKVGVVHRHPWPAEHPAAHRRGARRDHRVRCRHRGRGHRYRPPPRGAAQRHRGVVPRQHRRRRDVRRRRHAVRRPSPRSCSARTHETRGSSAPAATTWSRPRSSCSPRA